MIQLFFGRTSDDVTDEMLVHLKQVAQQSAHYIFVVPDRMTVIAEKRIFERLGIESTCNIEVLTLSRLFSKLVKDKAIISKSASCMILQKMLRDERENLLCFNKNPDADLAQVMFGTISQFKSCKVNFSEVAVKSGDKLLENKLHDIALVYQNYEKFLRQNGFFDSLDKLNFLLQTVKDNDYIRTSSFYFCGFDGLTMQGYEIVRAVASSSASCSFGLTHAGVAKNSHIYNDNFTANILSLFKDHKVEIFYNKNDSDLSEQQAFLKDNLFCFSPSCMKIKDSEIELNECKDFNEEVLSCAVKIKKMIMEQGFNFNDFLVAVPNLESRKNVIDDIFSKFDFNFYLDTSEKFSETVAFRFIKNATDLILENFSIKSVLTFLKNPLLQLSKEQLDDFEDYAIKYNVMDRYELKIIKAENCEFYENFNIVRKFLFDKTLKFSSKIEEAKTFKDHIACFVALLDDCEIKGKIDEFIARFYAQNDIKTARIFEQYYDIILNCFEELEEVLGEESCDFKTFISTIYSGLESVKISTTPLSINAVVVGDASGSFFERRRVMFVLGGIEKDFPKTFTDCGIISDDDIKNLSEKYKLEPSIFELNKKERFKAYELLLKPKQKLFLSYNYLDGEKSKIYDDISKMFLLEEGGKFAPLSFNTFERLDFLTKNCDLFVAKSNLTLSLRGLCDGVFFPSGDTASLQSSLQNFLGENYTQNFNFENKIVLKYSPFFNSKTTSVSQVESFMTCPFLHFAQRGLKLAIKDEGKLQRNFIGNIFHELAKIVLIKLKMPTEESVVKTTTEKMFDEIISKEEYAGILFSEANKILFKNMRREAVKFTLALNEQARHSRFVPTYFEERFSEQGKIQGVKIPCAKREISLVGQVDRVDVAGDYFRIIDYKTGDTNTSLAELFFGKKIQLHAYLKVCERSLKLISAGAYYLPIKGGFSDEKSTIQKKYQLKGSTLDDFELACISDDRFCGEAVDSDIVELKFKLQKGEKIPSGYSKVATKKDIQNFGDYAMKLIAKACDDIDKLDITPCPLVLVKDPCKTCVYSALCRFDRTLQNTKREVKAKISKENFEEQ